MDICTLLLGIAVGVFTGLVTNLLSWHFVQNILPLYYDRTYQGIRIDGTWVLEHVGSPADGKGVSPGVLSATFRQRAHSITGTATALVEKEGGSTEAVNYRVTGELRDRFVTLYLRTEDRHRIAHSSFLLEIVGDGRKMQGSRAFYGLQQEAVRAIECVWKCGSQRLVGSCSSN